MKPFMRALSILLVGQLVSASEEPLSGNYAYTRFDKEKNLRRDGQNFNLDDYYSLAFDGPARLYFSKPLKSSEGDLQATIERPKLDTWGQKKCEFPINYDDKATLYYKIRSFQNSMEILEIFRAYPDQKYNQLDIYAINMTDCSYRKAEAFKGYNYPAKPIYAAYSFWQSDRLDYFAFNEEKSGESCLSKYYYFVSNNTFSSPMKFSLLDGDKKDWEIEVLAPIEGEDNYWASLKNNDFGVSLKVGPYGSILKSTEQYKVNRESYYVRYAINNGYFGRCWRMESKKQMVKIGCKQYNKNLEKLFYQELDLDYESPMFAISNRPEGGLRLAALRCFSEDEYSCEQPEIRKYIVEEKRSWKYYEYKESCALSKRQQFGFIATFSSDCLFYGCSYKGRTTDDFSSSVIQKCF
ncbi:hypothetical protein QAD02_006578 [Eretmocerus hayati]|uniref:Uncharacterized protein n=1 Tax=Eretmocerus hayati TaxID=131215 RepID=A0ACC2N2G5_9HYME|nr:hypothetical protein QAD02_006578 [Eretmocerus hayati]